MSIPLPIENAYLRMTDAFFERRPQPRPLLERLRECKIVSHRGEHQSGLCAENSLWAFRRAAEAGVWGVELDVRWTEDMVPIVAHDADMHRLFGQPCEIARSTCAALQACCPGLVRLEDVVAEFGDRLHLMIEIKDQPWIDLPRQRRILAEALKPLDPGGQYHLITLAPSMLAALPDVPDSAKVAVAYVFPDRLSRWVVRHQWGGLCGHYLLMRQAIVEKHHRLGQPVGTGFANSINVLYREINRGVDWVFSNEAARMQAHVEECLSSLQ